MIAHIPDIREYLQRLEGIVRDKGDDRTANILKTIFESPDPFESLQKSLVRKGSKKCSDREKWFQEWSNGRARSQSKFLAKVTNDWELEDEQIIILSATAQIWIEHPYLFWYGLHPAKDVLERGYKDSRKNREVVPLQDKVIAIIMSEIIEKEQEDISKKGTKRTRSRHTGGHQKSGNVTSALRQIIENHWPQADKGFPKWLQQAGLGGKKLRFLPDGIVMTLYQANMKGFQEHGWKEIEKEALLAYTRTLPQMRGIALFSNTLRSVKEFYNSLKPTERPMKWPGYEIPPCNPSSSLGASETHLRVQSYGFDSNPNAAQITSPTTSQVDCEPSTHDFAEQHTRPAINTPLSDQIAARPDTPSPTTDLTEDDDIGNFSSKRPRFDGGEWRPSVYLKKDQRHPGLDLQYDSGNILPPLRVLGTNNIQENEQAQENAQTSSLPPVSSILHPTLPTMPAGFGFGLDS